VGIGTVVEIEFVGAMMSGGVAVGSAAQAVQTTIAAKISQRFIKTHSLSILYRFGERTKHSQLSMLSPK